MPHQRVSTTLPPELVAAVEQACEREHRTRSDLLRVALLRYLYPPKISETMLDEIEDYLELHDPQALEDIEASRRDIESGRVRAAEDLLAELEAEEDRVPASPVIAAPRS